jgi:hypothetical protein
MNELKPISQTSQPYHNKSKIETLREILQESRIESEGTEPRAMMHPKWLRKRPIAPANKVRCGKHLNLLIAYLGIAIFVRIVGFMDVD